MKTKLSDPQPVFTATQAPSTPDEFIAVRHNTHGTYSDQVRVTQELKRTAAIEEVLRTNRGQPSLTDGQREALCMVFTKIGRILAGDADFPDHWDDIAGYAILGRDSSSTSQTTPH